MILPIPRLDENIVREHLGFQFDTLRTSLRQCPIEDCKTIIPAVSQLNTYIHPGSVLQQFLHVLSHHIGNKLDNLRKNSYLIKDKITCLYYHF